MIGYRSPDPRLAANVANAIAKSYVEHTYNIRFRSSASLSTFMEKQLEELKAKMERSNAALAQFERELNVINPDGEDQHSLGAPAAVEYRLHQRPDGSGEEGSGSTNP